MEFCCPQQVVRSIRLGAQGENPVVHLLGSFAETHVCSVFFFDVFSVED